MQKKRVGGGLKPVAADYKSNITARTPNVFAGITAHTQARAQHANGDGNCMKFWGVDWQQRSAMATNGGVGVAIGMSCRA